MSERALTERFLFRVKICGITTPDDARMVAEAADAAAAPPGTVAVGLNFVTGSPRCIDVETAGAIVAALPAGVRRVGVFAGAEPGDMLRIAATVGLDALQLHGHLESSDPPERCRDLAPIPVIRAVRLETDGLSMSRAWIERAASWGASPAMMLVDSSVARGTAAGQLGGSGATVDWQALARERPLGIPTALAGGLTAANVEEAIRVTGLSAVDTASGVESSPGRKDLRKVREFIAAACRSMGLS